MGFGVAYRTDVHTLHEHWKRVIVEAGGELRRTRPVRSLRFLRRHIVGAGDVEARAVLLATGDFQGDFELVERFLGWDTDRGPIARTRPAPATASSSPRRPGRRRPRLGGFYGHLVRTR